MKVQFLKSALLGFAMLAVVSTSWCASLDAAGTVFIRQHTKSIKTYREVFLAQAQNLKVHGFTAYSLHRDLKDSHVVIVTLKCLDLEEGVHFIRSAEFMSAMDKADVQIPVVWYGVDLTNWGTLKLDQRQYSNQPEMTGGIVIARNEVRDYKFWLDCFYKEDGGKHNHPGRKYKNSNYTIHHLPGDPEVAIVAHEASDVSKAPVFMASEAMKGEMEATGVIGLEIWYGINLEEGLF
ncbi:MAG TPA: hypothetical protein VK791_05380 [bacterium]|jgi:hypothetical protein|nr:hypothetical protein [bacterium]